MKKFSTDRDKLEQILKFSMLDKAKLGRKIGVENQELYPFQFSISSSVVFIFCYYVYSLDNRLAFLFTPHGTIDNLFSFQVCVGIQHAGGETPYGIEPLVWREFCRLVSLAVPSTEGVVPFGAEAVAQQPQHHLRTLGPQIVFPCHLVQHCHNFQLSTFNFQL